MSTSPHCYIPQKGIDDVIAANVPGWNSAKAALVRGLYDENHDTPLDTSDPIDAAKKLAQYRKEVVQNHAKSINTQSTNIASAFKRLKEDFTAEERFNRVNMIAGLFSNILDRLQSANPQYSREMLCHGFEMNGRQVAGEMAIFESIFDTLLEKRNQYLSSGYRGAADKIDHVLDNWGALVTLTRMKLRDTEGIRLGNKLEYAEMASQEDFGDNDITALYTAEESTREHWQETNDMRSAFGSISTQVRGFLGSLHQVDSKGKVVRDDLGFVKTIDTVKAHQYLTELLRGATSQEQMIGLIRNAAQNEPWLRQVLTALEDRKSPDGRDITNYRLRTLFYVDFKKNFQPYSISTESVKNGIHTFKTKMLNKIENLLSGNYLTRVMLGRPINAEISIFDRKGNVNWANLQKLRTILQEYFPDASTTIVQKFFDNKQTTYEEKKRVIKDVLQSLGIDIDDNTVTRILASSKASHRLANYLSQLSKWGIDKNLLNAERKALDEGQFSTLEERHFKKLLYGKHSYTGSEGGNFIESINKILQLITENREGLRLESRCLWKDAKGNNITLFSNVNSSYLGDFIGKIQNFVEHNDKNGLKKFLASQYLDSSMFIDADGNILNKWIEELVSGNIGDNSFAANFQYKRYVGNSVRGGDRNNFENFTSKQHLISMMNEYFSVKQQSPNKNYAWYPVFTMGDSGISKYIMARRYTTEELLDGMYNVYRSEMRRMEQAKAANEKLTSEGYSLIDNFSNTTNTYTMLPFLNADHIAFDGTIGKYYKIIQDNPTEQNVKAAIKAYMNDAVSNFKKNAQNLGVLDTVNSYNHVSGKNETKYKYLGQEIKGTKTEDDVLADFFWNVKFATIQQLQLTTIDPGFYKNSKDLQKRYKEIHAPGVSIDINARNPYSNEHELFNPVDEQGRPQPERCLYFDDIDIDSEEFNPEFMKAIEAHFGKDSKIYKDYKSNTLTDGQGYRTLASYRKVMGMSGKWTAEMENAYKEIQDIRAKYGKEDIPMDDLIRIGELAVIFQPIKPFVYTIENYALNDNDKLKIPVQHKYAEAVIIPELLPKGSKLRDIAYWMEEHTDDNGKSSPIDVIGSTKIVKVGGFGATSIKGAKTAEELENALSKGYVHQLNYADYRIQTNVPEHINSSQLFGTQVRKLIMAGVKKGAYYDAYVGGNTVNLGGNYKNVRLTGRNLIAFYNSLITANIVDSYHSFERDMSDPETISDILIQNVINNSRESMDNLVAFGIEDGDFAVPLFEGGIEHDTSAMLMSIFRKRVNKQSIKGGSAVQMSAMGIDGYKEDGGLRYISDPSNPDNILYAEAEIPFDLSITDAQGNNVNLKFEDWCNPDGTLKLDTSKELDMSKKGNRLYQSYYTTDENGNKHYYKPLIEQAYPNILSVLAYRIPTERDYSMINIRVKRFSQKTAGGTIKVPAQGTTIAGFDFDIDKLYFMRSEYKVKELSTDEVAKIWNALYNANPKIKNALKDAKISNEEAQSLVASILRSFSNSDLAQEIADTSLGKDQLYKYWKDAGLEGTPKQFFSKFLRENPQVLRSIRKDQNIFEEYDYTKPPLENTRISRNNMLIHLMQERLMDIETFNSRYTPGGFRNSSNAARFMRELKFGDLDGIVSSRGVDIKAIDKRIADGNVDPEPLYDASDPMTQVIYNQQNQVASKLIGIFANQNTNHALVTLMETLKINDQYAFTLCGKQYTDLLHAPDGIDTSLNIAEFLAASVDAVKDPVLNFLNLNTLTADSGAILARLGYNTKEIGLLFNQPIIVKVCEYAFNKGVNLDEAIRQVSNSLKSNSSESIPKPNPDIDFSANQLAENIVRDRMMSSKGKDIMSIDKYRINQLNILDLFSTINKVATDITSLVTSTKFTASNAVGSTFGDLYAQQMKVNKFVQKFNNTQLSKASVIMRTTDKMASPISNSTETLNMNDTDYIESLIENPLAYEQAMYDANRKVLALLNKYYPYETRVYKMTRQKMGDLLKFGTLDADIINSIHRDLLVYLVTQQGGLFNGDFPCKNGIPAKNYYREHFVQEVFNILEIEPELKNLPLFQYLQFQANETFNPVTERNEISYSMNMQDVGGLNSYQKEEIKDSWAELYRTHPELARDLFVYNFYKLGFTFSPLSFMSLAPIELKKNIYIGDSGKNYIDFLKEIQKGDMSIDYNDFIKQYILNHLDNKKLTYSPKDNYLKSIRALAKTGAKFNSSFDLDITQMDDKDANVWTLNSEGLLENEIAFRPCLIIDNNIYVAQSNNSDMFNVSTSGVMRYIKMEALGKNNISLQYNANSTISTSDKNNSEISDQEGIVQESEAEEQGKVFDRTAFEKEIVEEVIKTQLKAGEIMGEEVDKVRETLLEAVKQCSDEDIRETVDEIRKEAEKEGLEVLDENGNPKPAC